MTDRMTTMPTQIAAWLVAGHVDQLWQQWANETDPDMRGCCNRCCGPCAAMKELYDRGELDALYGAYVGRVGGDMETWDAEKRQVGREWLHEAWSVDPGCHD
jgi:hypothetical protein